MEVFEKQIRLLGEAAQARLRAARVLVVGAGGLGSYASTQLAAMGVGTIGLADFDRVEASNLARQILHRPSDVGRRKTDSGKDALLARQPWVEVQTHEARVTEANAELLISGYDVILDGSDNYATRYVLSDACLRGRKPLIFAALGRWEGQLAVFDASHGPCYRCVFPSPGGEGACADVGVIAATVSILGSLQALEAVKWITEMRCSTDKMITIDFATLRFRTFTVQKNPDCVCSKGACLVSNRFLTPEELVAKIGKCRVFDLRPVDEFDTEHIPTSESISLSQLDDLTLRDEEIVFYCSGSQRAAFACDRISSRAPRARFLVGGFTAWKKNGYEISN